LTTSLTVSGGRRDSQQSKVQHHPGRETEACNSQLSSRTSVPRRPPSPWQYVTTHCYCYKLLPSRNWNLRPCIIPFTFQTSLHPPVMCLRAWGSIERTKISQLKRGEWDGAFLLSTTSTPFCFRQQAHLSSIGIQKLVERYEKSIAKAGDYMGRITSHLDLYMWCASQYKAICPCLLKSLVIYRGVLSSLSVCFPRCSIN
jgi:hypothetical protein